MATLKIVLDEKSFTLENPSKELEPLNDKFKLAEKSHVEFKNKKYNNLCSLCPKYLLKVVFPESNFCNIAECVTTATFLLETP